jgi:hypothetical protein
MNPMFRCLALALALLAGAPLVAAQTQQPRNFPPGALRGELVLVNPPEILLNGKAARLSPGARIRGQNNFLVLTGSLEPTKTLVHYTLDNSGALRDVWLLRPEEAAVKPWPASVEEAQAWSFDATAQTWTKP